MNLVVEIFPMADDDGGKKLIAKFLPPIFNLPFILSPLRIRAEPLLQACKSTTLLFSESNNNIFQTSLRDFFVLFSLLSFHYAMAKSQLKLTCLNAADLVAAFEKLGKAELLDQQTKRTSIANLQHFKRRLHSVGNDDGLPEEHGKSM